MENNKLAEEEKRTSPQEPEAKELIEESSKEDKIRNISEASNRAREELVRLNGAMGVIMLQFESINLIDYKNKPSWKVKCSFFTDLAGTTRVRKELFIDRATGEIALMNGT